MPPKVKITEQDVINFAFDIIREKGVDKLTAREIADRLECSTQPIFSYFANMSDLRVVR